MWGQTCKDLNDSTNPTEWSSVNLAIHKRKKTTICQPLTQARHIGWVQAWAVPVDVFCCNEVALRTTVISEWTRLSPTQPSAATQGFQTGPRIPSRVSFHRWLLVPTPPFCSSSSPQALLSHCQGWGWWWSLAETSHQQDPTPPVTDCSLEMVRGAQGCILAQFVQPFAERVPYAGCAHPLVWPEL